MGFDARALLVRMGLERDTCGDDLHRRERHLEVDLHVVDRQRVRVDLDVEPWRLLITDGTTDQEEIVTLAERTDPVLAIVEHLERRAAVVGGIEGQDRRVVEQVVDAPCRRCYCRIGHRSKVTQGSCPTSIGKTGDVTRLQVSTLTGTHVQLEPLSHEHVHALTAAAAIDRETFGYTQVPDGHDETVAYVDWLLEDAAHGRVAPFAQRRLADDTVVGCTRFMSPLSPLGRSDPDEIEIGGTWLAASAQRSGVNSDAKLLLLSHAFDVWSVQRVAICTDARNTRSCDAIERLGARFEGTMRRHRRSTRAGEGGRLRDTATYAITVDDWPDVRAALVERLHRHGPLSNRDAPASR